MTAVTASTHRRAAVSAAARPLSQSRRAVLWGLAAVPGACVFFILFLLVLSPVQEQRDQDVLYTQFRSELAAATAPIGTSVVAPGAPVALLEVPAIGLRQVVVNGTSGYDLRHGPGYLRTTPLPGQAGTSAIFGRSTTYGAPFAHIGSLTKGSQIQVTTGQGVFVYRVLDVRHEGDPQPPALANGAGRLLLVSTDRTSWGAQHTLYVDASLASKAAPTPPHPVQFVPTYENEMQSDPSQLLPLTLWLFLLVLVVAFASWGVVHWGKAQTWVIVVPVALVALWCASDSASVLLPNLM